ncbi:MAG: Gfo/Idh/MocA family oxidoreductase [Chloroflexi bacterium]|nr:Gfo/Idh/MocA family oxidoreductase [Chloroflexota bacterium]
MTEPLRVGVVGSGVGRAHVAAFQSLPDQFRVSALCDVDESKACALASECSIPRLTTDVGELCRLDDLDVIDLCTPSHLHYEQVLLALAAGKHVICEKPVAGSLQQVDELAVAEKQSGRRVMPIFQFRFGHGAQKLKFLIDEGIAGRAYLTTAETAWRRKADYYAVPWRGKWETELGGPMVTLAIHAHDLVHYIVGPARRVWACTATLVNPIETEDCVVASLEMADGSLCALSVTTGSAQQISRHRFCFRNLTAESHTQPYSNTSDPWQFTGDSPELQQRLDEALTRFIPLPEGFAGQFYRFYHALQDNRALPVTLADARASLELITAVYYAAQTRQVVDLPLGRHHPWYAGWRR